MVRYFCWSRAQLKKLSPELERDGIVTLSLGKLSLGYTEQSVILCNNFTGKTLPSWSRFVTLALGKSFPGAELCCYIYSDFVVFFGS